MKKVFLLLLCAITMSFVGCNKGQNEPDNSGDSTATTTTDNPYPYLRQSDLMPLGFITLAQAEAKLAQMGFNGGWQAEQKEYIYTSADKKETIQLSLTADLGVTEVFYRASKGIIPSVAKEWLAHIPEKVAIPAKAAELTGVNEISFTVAGSRSPDMSSSTYAEYLEMLKNLASGMELMAMWGEPFWSPSEPSGYYGGILMNYLYENSMDEASLSISFRYHEKEDPNEPIQPVRYLHIQEITALHLITQSEAEQRLAEMGFTGTKLYEGGEEYILYTSADKNDSIVFGYNEEGLIAMIGYNASKGIKTQDAKYWLSNFSEEIELPLWYRWIPFDRAWVGMCGNETSQEVFDTYRDYINQVDQLTEGMSITATWEVPEEDLPEDANIAYSVAMSYSYADNKDHASIHIGCQHYVTPVFPEEN